MTGTADPRPPEEIERDIEATRAEMAETLDVIERKLAPGQLIDQAVDYLRAEGTGSRVGEVIKRNPLPVVLIGVGLAWLALSELSGRPGDPRGPRTAADDRRPDPLAYAAAAGAAAGREHLVAWLRDAHALEQQAIEMLERNAERLETYPQLKARLAQHLEESRQQQATVARAGGDRREPLRAEGHRHGPGPESADDDARHDLRRGAEERLRATRSSPSRSPPTGR